MKREHKDIGFCVSVPDEHYGTRLAMLINELAVLACVGPEKP